MNIEGEQHPNWETLFVMEPFRLLYVLQIVDTLLFPVDERENFDLRLRWCSSFLSTGGLSRILQIVLSNEFLPPIGSSENETTTKSSVQSSSSFSTLSQRRSCLALLLKIVDFFIQFIGSINNKTTLSSSSLSDETQNFHKALLGTIQKNKISFLQGVYSLCCFCILKFSLSHTHTLSSSHPLTNNEYVNQAINILIIFYQKLKT